MKAPRRDRQARIEATSPAKTRADAARSSSRAFNDGRPTPNHATSPLSPGNVGPPSGKSGAESVWANEAEATGDTERNGEQIPTDRESVETSERIYPSWPWKPRM